MGRTTISTQPPRIEELIEAVSHPGAGGVATFVGMVRDHHEGRAVTSLEYEAYESMAATELAAVATEVEAAIPGVRVAVTHRVGQLAIGDVAVVCAASAAHRQQAFEACRQLIELVKERVPIWKKEHSPDGTQWVGWPGPAGGAAGADGGPSAPDAST